MCTYTCIDMQTHIFVGEIFPEYFYTNDSTNFNVYIQEKKTYIKKYA